jgi:hypothetical protein
MQAFLGCCSLDKSMIKYKSIVNTRLNKELEEGNKY